MALFDNLYGLVSIWWAHYKKCRLIDSLLLCNINTTLCAWLSVEEREVMND